MQTKPTLAIHQLSGIMYKDRIGRSEMFLGKDGWHRKGDTGGVPQEGWRRRGDIEGVTQEGCLRRGDAGGVTQERWRRRGDTGGVTQEGWHRGWRRGGGGNTYPETIRTEILSFHEIEHKVDEIQ